MIKKFAAVAGAAALLVGSGVAIGNAQDAAEPLQACVNDTNGGMRLVVYGEECRKGESPVTWNAQGPAGPQGPAGATDIGLEYVSYDGIYEFQGITGEVYAFSRSVSCPEGKVALAPFGSAVGTLRGVSGPPDNLFPASIYGARLNPNDDRTVSVAFARADGEAFTDNVDIVEYSITVPCMYKPAP